MYICMYALEIIMYFVSGEETVVTRDHIQDEAVSNFACS